MLILFDHGTPKGLTRALPGHTIITAQAQGWDKLSNGALLNAAEEAAIDLLLTTDRRIGYQQNLAGRKIALVVLTGTTKWSRVRLHLDGRHREYCDEPKWEALDGALFTALRELRKGTERSVKALEELPI
jgi:hypothetical protein